MENYNEITISGIINNITDTNDKYIKFSIVAQKYTSSDNKDVYIGLNVSRELYNNHLDCFYKGNKIYVKGYLNSYSDRNKIIRHFITVTNIFNNSNDIIKGKNKSHISYDLDGMMVWNGKRCESKIATKEEQEEMRRMLQEI